ncbi:MAG TPA: hypothetical protein VNV85_03900 [Puia sp.]|jgi:hypothetical protein|nr:hypothetical protein [Puia sp.]
MNGKSGDNGVPTIFTAIASGAIGEIFWNREYVAEFEVCFNSTEFYRGLSFRFQTEGDLNPKQVIGNKYGIYSTLQQRFNIFILLAGCPGGAAISFFIYIGQRLIHESSNDIATPCS